MSEATAQRVDEEVRELVMRGYETARQIVETQRDSVRAMAEELLAVESLDADGIKAVDCLARRRGARGGRPVLANRGEPARTGSPGGSSRH